MRIDAVRVRILRAPNDDGVELSFAQMAHRATALVEIEAGGLVGHGESWINFPPWADRERRATIDEGVAPLLIGRDARDVEARHADMVAALVPLGRQWGAPGPIMQAISGADIALWDLAGKAEAVPVAELLGGRVRDSVPLYGSGLGPDGVAELAEDCARRGLPAVKVRVGFGAERDAANVRAARAAGLVVMVDANRAWTMEDALALAPVLQDCAVAWVEEPLADDAPERLAEFADRSGLTVAAGENVYGRAAFEPLLAQPGIAVLQPDVSKCGGLTEALAVCRRAAACGRVVAPHLYGGAVAYAATLQVAACCEAVATVEYDVRANPLRDGLLSAPPPLEDGCVRVPERPGLGLELNPAAIDVYAV